MPGIDADAAKLAGLQIDMLQKCRAGNLSLREMEWWFGLKGDERQRIMGGNPLSPKPPIVAPSAFSLLHTTKQVVPRRFRAKGYLDRFKRNNEAKFTYGYNGNIVEANYGSPSCILAPGEQFLVKFIGIKRQVSSAECMDVYREHGAHFVGAPGLALLWEQKRKEFPLGKWALSFDEESNLWVDAVGYLRVPNVCRGSDVGFGFYLGVLERPWDDFCVLVLFCDLPDAKVAAGDK